MLEFGGDDPNYEEYDAQRDFDDDEQDDDFDGLDEHAAREAAQRKRDNIVLHLLRIKYCTSTSDFYSVSLFC